MAPPIRFYFDFVSAYSYVAMNRIDTVAARYGREVDWCVVVLADVFAHHNATSPRDQPAKFAHNAKDFPRLCTMNGLPVTFPPEVPPHGASLHRLVFLRLKRKDPALAKRFALAVDNRYFGLGKEVRTARQLASACKVYGVDIAFDEIKAAEGDRRAKKALADSFDQAIDDGMFGAPFMVCDGETFWGADRLDHLEYSLKRKIKLPKGFQPFALRSNFTERNGPLFQRVRNGKITFAFRVDDRHLNPLEVVHGGWLTSFVDVSMAQSALFQIGRKGISPTIHLETDFISAITPGQWVECQANLVNRTRSMNFVEGVVTADGTPVARCSGIFKVPRDLRG
ncbi:MAG: DsbA family protein [Alphaproteobacteria bacterium]|nr:DsbA family protein [Alphaproteobacteria bacterium]MCZ6844589.1 DsbA family protein [Alphaproteobacteria bacterium]